MGILLKSEAVPATVRSVLMYFKMLIVMLLTTAFFAGRFTIRRKPGDLPIENN